MAPHLSKDNILAVIEIRATCPCRHAILCNFQSSLVSKCPCIHLTDLYLNHLPACSKHLSLTFGFSEVSCLEGLHCAHKTPGDEALLTVCVCVRVCKRDTRLLKRVL